MAFLPALVVAAGIATGTAGIAYGVSSLMNKGKSGGFMNETLKTSLIGSTASDSATETNEAAITKAKEDVAKKRRQALATGGRTDITQGKGLLTSGQVKVPTLLGG